MFKAYREKSTHAQPGTDAVKIAPILSRFSTTLELPTYVTFGKYKLYMPVIRYICVFVILNNYFRKYFDFYFDCVLLAPVSRGSEVWGPLRPVIRKTP